MNRNELPATTTTRSGALQLVPGTYAKDRPLPIVNGILETQSGPVRVAGQVMTAEGPVLIPIPPRD